MSKTKKPKKTGSKASPDLSRAIALMERLEATLSARAKAVSGPRSEATSELRERRLAKGLTLAALAEASGISTRTLVRHERNATFPAYEAQRKALEKALA